MVQHPRMKILIIVSVLLIGILHAAKNDHFPDLINSEPWLYWQRLGVFHQKLPKRLKMESVVIQERIKQKILRIKIANILGQAKKLNVKTRTNTKKSANMKSARFARFNQYHKRP